MALSHGVLVDSYLAENGVFKANAFVNHIREHNQHLSYCGVNVHHKNVVAEQSICTVSECHRAMLLHANLHWKDGINSNLWPMAVEYSSYLYNALPSASGPCPADLFTGVQSPCHKLKDIQVWGAPVYALDPAVSSHVDNLVPEKEFLWVSAVFTPVMFPLFSISKLVTSLHNIMLSLMMSSQQSKVSVPRMNLTLFGMSLALMTFFMTNMSFAFLWILVTTFFSR